MEVTEQNFEFILKTKMRYGVGLTKKLPEILKGFSFGKLGIVVDGRLLDNSKWLQAVFEECKREFPVFIIHEYREKFEPSYQFLERTRSLFARDKSPLVDCIVGIGGGSVIDSAKGFATLATNHGPAKSYRGFPTNLDPPLPVIAIPSTAGTGSELAFNAVFIDLDENKKLGINSTANYPFLSILDPELIRNAPKSVIVSSGLDALVHTLESFVSKKSNLLSRFYSKEAFRLIINNLPALAKDPGNLEFAAKMQFGAYLAMAALSNTSAGPTGGLSYLLGTEYNVPHGIAGAVFIGRVTRFNHDKGYYDYEELCDSLGEPAGPREGRKARSEFVVKSIERLLVELGIPSDLSGFGVTAKDFDKFYTFSSVNLKGAFEFNPVAFSPSDLNAFLSSLMK